MGAYIEIKEGLKRILFAKVEVSDEETSAS